MNKPLYNYVAQHFKCYILQFYKNSNSHLNELYLIMVKIYQQTLKTEQS